MVNEDLTMFFKSVLSDIDRDRSMIKFRFPPNKQMTLALFSGEIKLPKGKLFFSI